MSPAVVMVATLVLVWSCLVCRTVFGDRYWWWEDASMDHATFDPGVDSLDTHREINHLMAYKKSAGTLAARLDEVAEVIGVPVSTPWPAVVNILRTMVGEWRSDRELQRASLRELQRAAAERHG